MAHQEPHSLEETAKIIQGSQITEQKYLCRVEHKNFSLSAKPAYISIIKGKIHRYRMNEKENTKKALNMF